ncbi:GNAT family N-acetyltransferase [Nocardia blacklockiae]|uniref:GNAT family N-acetyltransferase n=1 Tax=Nocardia blacklockiae TaxID=480036 RepID=UPI001895FD8D|nr:GNAT family N-acetyltransferase [Nocardia blacklockiae]MBF6175591.1 GNAT family N-acetyltransferase [Nocardia blacklockiae]
MGDGVIVRRVPAGDWRTARVARLAALAGSAPGTFSLSYEDAAAWDEDRWREWAAGRVLFVAESGGDVLGCVGGLLEYGVPTLVSMFVAASVRGTGVSDRLVDAVVAWAREAGHPRLHLWVTHGNSPAKKLYLRKGFAPSGRKRPGSLDSPRVDYEMVRSL